MCVYCTMGDSWFRHDPPWKVAPLTPYVPQPVDPSRTVDPWKIDKLKEYLEVLKEVKRIEDQIGCPCVPNKADYIGMFEKRIKALKRRSRANKKRGRK